MTHFNQAPYFLATNRGFYRADADYNKVRNNDLLFTSNFRRATPFSSYEAAEKLFSKLLAAGTCYWNTVSPYFAVLAAPVLPVNTVLIHTGNVSLRTVEQQLRNANSCCSDMDEVINIKVTKL